MDLLKRLWDQTLRLFKGMTAGQRLSLAALGLTVAISIGMLVFTTKGANYVPLFNSEITMNNMAEITPALDQMGVEFKIMEGRIMVPYDKKDQIAMQLSTQGLLPEAEDPFDFLYQTHFDRTNRIINLQNLRGLEKKLARVIEALDSVERAWVTISDVEKSKFVFDKTEEGSASVQLKLRFGRTLNKGEVEAIASIISKSLRNIPKDNIAITDTHGIPYKVEKSDPHSVAANALEVKKLYENYHNAKVVDLLGKFIPGVSAVVNITLNPKKMEEVNEDVGGELSEIRNTMNKALKVEKVGPPVNMVGVPSNDRNNSGSGGERENTEEKLKDDQAVAFDRMVKKIESMPDAIDAITVAVAVPYSIAAQAMAGQQAPSDPAAMDQLVAKNLDSYKNLVIGALGDKVTVKMEAVNFKLEEIKIPELSNFQLLLEFAQNNWYKAALLSFVFAAFMMVYFTLKRSLPDLTIQEDSEPEDEEEVNFLPEIKMGAQEIKVTQMKEKIKEGVVSDPDSASDLVSRWLRKR